ncbi:MAG: dimethylsulfonioproprionate lyase family protein [Pseudomonadota bacterium]
MTTRGLFDAALAAVKDWHSNLPALHRFCRWPDDLAYATRSPRRLPASDLIGSAPGKISPSSAPLVQAIQTLAPHLEWRHTYTAEEVGQHFLDTFAWFELAGPTGHFITHQTRITAAYWGPGLMYDRHQHAAEEIYSVVSGEARFMSDGDKDETLGPDSTRYHASHQPHALRTLESPLFVFVFWRGHGLGDAPAMSPT